MVVVTRKREICEIWSSLVCFICCFFSLKHFQDASGMDLMMSESPGSVMERVQTLKYFPQAVPSSLLLPE